MNNELNEILKEFEERPVKLFFNEYIITLLSQQLEMLGRTRQKMFTFLPETEKALKGSIKEICKTICDFVDSK